MQPGAANLKVWAVAFVGAVASAVALAVALAVGSEPARAVPPDAKGKIAFASDRAAGNMDIWVMKANGTNPVQLTNDPLPEVFPAWSPDGKQIAFARGVRGGAQIFVMNADGTGQTQLTTNGRSAFPAWSPDGKQIAFVHAVLQGDPPVPNREIFVMGSDGSNPTNLTNDPAFDLDPDWSADGKQIAFSSNRSSGDCGFAVHTMRSNGTDVRQLTDVSLEAFSPAWSPDGKEVAFSDQACNAESDLFVIKANGKSVTQLVDTPENETGATWSPDGERIAFESFHLQRNEDGELEFVSGSGEIYVIGNDGEGQKNLTNKLGADDQHPDWSPK